MHIYLSFEIFLPWILRYDNYVYTYCRTKGYKNWACNVQCSFSEWIHTQDFPNMSKVWLLEVTINLALFLLCSNLLTGVWSNWKWSMVVSGPVVHLFSVTTWPQIFYYRNVFLLQLKKWEQKVTLAWLDSFCGQLCQYSKTMLINQPTQSTAVPLQTLLFPSFATLIVRFFPQRTFGLWLIFTCRWQKLMTILTTVDQG